MPNRQEARPAGKRLRRHNEQHGQMQQAQKLKRIAIALLVRIDEVPAGEILAEVILPVRCPTMPVFGTITRACLRMS